MQNNIHHSVRIKEPVNIYDACIAEGCFIGPFVEVGGAVIDQNTTISSHSYICPHVTIGRDCFIGHGVMFTNDSFETPETYSSIAEMKAQWTPRMTEVGNCVRIGSGSMILPVRIGDNAIIGLGSVVTKDVPAGETWCGNPARKIK